MLILCLAGAANASSLDSLVKECDDCHGNNGVSLEADIPTIAGFSATTIEDMMFAYIDKKRPATRSKFRRGDTGRPATDMYVIATNLAETDIERLAAYYAKQTFIASKQKFNRDLVQAGSKLHTSGCVKCHEAGGSSADDDAGILAGQWIPYLQQAFKEYRSGERKTLRKMTKEMNKLSEKDIDALIHFYASQQE